ncbi:MAG: preprotein translocase subunit YajC [Microbacteriaceae bacterium]|nr:preprotein translocase subunit YajC [Microbacteriaceae bacterium]
MQFDFTTILMIAVLGVLVIFMIRNGRKRQKDALELQKKVVTGASVMTSFGVYATVKSIDEAENKVVLEISPKTTMTVARQAVVRVLDDVDAPAADESKK